MSTAFRPLETQSILAPLGVRFRDAVTGALIETGLRVKVYPTANPSRVSDAIPNRSGTYVVHKAAGLHHITRGAGDDNFWRSLPPGQQFTAEVFDERGDYLPLSFQLRLPVRGLFTWIWPLSDSTATPQPPEAGKSFGDDFDNPAPAPERWRLGTLSTPLPGSMDTTMVVAERNARLEIDTKSGSGRRYYGYLSAVTWNMTNARASVKAAQVSQTAANLAEAVFTISADTNNWYRFIARAGKLAFQRRLSGADDQVEINYDVSQHLFWRFRHDRQRDEVVFETRGDNTAWTRQRALRRQFPITAMTVELGAGTSQSTPVQTIAFDDFLMETNPIPSVPLFASPARAPQGGMAVVRATLWNPLTNGPASFAVFEARVPGGQTVRAVADREGRVALHFPYPEPIVLTDPQAKPIPLTSQEWALDVRAYYKPPNPLPRVPDLAATLAQPRATLWSDEARMLQLTRVPNQNGQGPLRFGQPLVLRTQRINSNAPLEPTPLAVLFVTPPAS
ncbi:MAG TPA: hypothetical protein VK422_22040 [Pyrinomonadaceae bacterium]|nr:hypothetical protein [Pyrinomonadaceae bacterium]